MVVEDETTGKKFRESTPQGTQQVRQGMGIARDLLKVLSEIVDVGVSLTSAGWTRSGIDRVKVVDVAGV